jgi:hypothetical protein
MIAYENTIYLRNGALLSPLKHFLIYCFPVLLEVTGSNYYLELCDYYLLHCYSFTRYICIAKKPFTFVSFKFYINGMLYYM